MPIDTQTQDGLSNGGRHRLTKASVRVYESSGITINGRSLYEKRLSESQILDAPPPKITGVRNIRFLGWRGGRSDVEGATVRITGTSRLPATILSVASEIAQ